MEPTFLAFAGSTRADSFNRKLVQAATREAETLGAGVTLINLGDFPLPIFNQDLEADEGPPQHVLELQRLFMQHQALLLACPEYNSSLTPLLKNVIDWVSRPTEAASGLEAFQSKVTGLLSASPGRLGGLRGLVHVRSILSSMGVVVLPEQHAVSQANDAFTDAGELTREADVKGVKKVVAAWVNVTRALARRAE